MSVVVRSSRRGLCTSSSCNPCCDSVCDPCCEPACAPACGPVCGPVCDPCCKTVCDPCCDPCPLPCGRRRIVRTTICCDSAPVVRVVKKTTVTTVRKTCSTMRCC